MKKIPVDRKRIKSAWEGRISGCQLGKAVEALTYVEGNDSLTAYLKKAKAIPLRDYIPLIEGTLVEIEGRKSCKGFLCRSEPDDDITFTVLALMLLEKHGLEISTEDVARAWLTLIPGGAVFTAEKAAYLILLERAELGFTFGFDPGFDISECADNDWSEWIGAQIRADIYGWVCPGMPDLAAELAKRDAALSHTGDGIHGAAFIAALGAAIPASKSISEAINVASRMIPGTLDTAHAISFGLSLVGKPDAVRQLHERYQDLPVAHTLNNLALVVWGLLSGEEDYSTAIGDVVAAGWDTDCNGATVGGLWGLQGKTIPTHWTSPWQGRVAVTIAGTSELKIDDLVDRTVKVAQKIIKIYD
jgi:ADP-ribosylglycohydrolase